jgi:hypothetical protein
MTSTPPQLMRCLAFITERLAKASRDAQMRPSKVHQQRVRSLELLAAACVSEAARLAVRSRVPQPRLDPEPRPRSGPEPPPPLPPDETRGVWPPPAG